MNYQPILFTACCKETLFVCKCTNLEIPATRWVRHITSRFGRLILQMEPFKWIRARFINIHSNVSPIKHQFYILKIRSVQSASKYQKFETNQKRKKLIGENWKRIHTHARAHVHTLEDENYSKTNTLNFQIHWDHPRYKEKFEPLSIANWMVLVTACETKILTILLILRSANLQCVPCSFQ